MRLFLPVLTFLALAAPAAAQQATGLWLRENGLSQVRISPCGPHLCGFVAWVKDPEHASDIGLKVFYNMKPSGPASWEGEAYNPEDGKTYTGKLVVEGETLKTSGCVFGGLICKSVTWTRLK